MFVGDQRSLCPANTEMQCTLRKLHHFSLSIVLQVSTFTVFFNSQNKQEDPCTTLFFFFRSTDIAPDDILYLIYIYLSTHLLLSVFSTGK